MKKILLISMLLLCFSLITDAKKPKKVYKFKVEYVTPPSERGKQLLFTCSCSPQNQYFVRNFKMQNNSNERVYIEWENARVGNSKLVFGTDNDYSKAGQKADEAVAASMTSQRRDITGLDNVEDPNGILSNYLAVILPFDTLKKNVGQTATLDILIPIRYSDNTEEDLKFRITGWYEYEGQK